MIIKSAAGRAFAAVCLTAIATFSGAHAQMGPTPGSYGAPPGGGLWLRTRPLRPSTRRLRPLWPPTGNLCPAEPICRAIGWNEPDNQRTAGQPG
jgi:hypothetical protein